MYAYGKNVAKEMLEKKEEIEKAYLYQNFKDKDIINELEKQNIKIVYLNKNEMDYKVNGNHQGIILKTKEYEYTDIDETINEDIVVILDHLEDPHNFGAIIRTCEAAGIKSIIIPKDRSVKVNGTVIKVSVGTIKDMKISIVNNLVNTINMMKKQGFWIIGTDMQGTDYKQIDYSGKIALVIGNEGKGLSRLTKENCDFIASIPMKGKVNSLNASVAAALVIYEAVRNR